LYNIAIENYRTDVDTPAERTYEAAATTAG
jgi:hypothetical protein